MQVLVLAALVPRGLAQLDHQRRHRHRHVGSMLCSSALTELLRVHLSPIYAGTSRHIHVVGDATWQDQVGQQRACFARCQHALAFG